MSTLRPTCRGAWAMFFARRVSSLFLALMAAAAACAQDPPARPPPGEGTATSTATGFRRPTSSELVLSAPRPVKAVSAALGLGRQRLALVVGNGTAAASRLSSRGRTSGGRTRSVAKAASCCSRKSSSAPTARAGKLNGKAPPASAARARSTRLRAPSRRCRSKAVAGTTRSWTVARWSAGSGAARSGTPPSWGTRWPSTLKTPTVQASCCAANGAS